MPDLFGPDVDGAAIGVTGDKALSPEFDKRKFADLIETKGYRLAWSRASACPCRTQDPQNVAPDFNCELCRRNQGLTYFRPSVYETTAVEGVGKLTSLQKHLVDRSWSPAVVVRGVVMGVGKNQENWSQLGDWAWGSYSVTVRPENRITYQDRLTVLDAKMPYSQIVIVRAKTGPIEPRFPILQVNFCRTVDRIYTAGADFEVDDDGSLVFATRRRPALNSRISIHYDHHPQFLVQEHLNTFRDSVLRIKDPEKRQTPVGSQITLPIRAVAKLEFLIGTGTGT